MNPKSYYNSNMDLSLQHLQNAINCLHMYCLQTNPNMDADDLTNVLKSLNANADIVNAIVTEIHNNN